MKVLFLLLFSLILAASGIAQSSPSFDQIRQYTRLQPPSRYDSLQRTITHQLRGELHYLYPLYQALSWENKFRDLLGDAAYAQSVSQHLAFLGDYEQALQIGTKAYGPLPDTLQQSLAAKIKNLDNIQYVPARSTILETAKDYEVVMINEHPARPAHRVFTYSLLEGLFNQGFRYLAWEAGAVFTEPVGGEIIRKAKDLGYTVIDLGDSTGVPGNRDSIQAEHLRNFFQQYPEAKIIVQATYGQTSEIKSGSFTPLAYWFKKISKINPLTIEQSEMSEGSNFELGRLFYDQFSKRFILNEPAIVLHNKRPFRPFGDAGNDLVVMHPKTNYKHRRPDWLSFNGDREQVMIQPTEKKLFLVQAYYASEYTESTANQVIPADQTYVSDADGYYYIYLRKGVYTIVLRDVGYKVLSVKEMVVK